MHHRYRTMLWLACFFGWLNVASAQTERVNAIYLQKYGALAGFEIGLALPVPLSVSIGTKAHIRWLKLFFPYARMRLNPQGYLHLEELIVHPTLRLKYDLKNRLIAIGKYDILYRQDGRVQSIKGMKFTYDLNGRIEKIGKIKIVYRIDSTLDSIGALKFHYKTEGRLGGIGAHMLYYHANGRVQRVGEWSLNYHPFRGTLQGVKSKDASKDAFPSFQISVFWDNRTLCKALTGKRR